MNVYDRLREKLRRTKTKGTVSISAVVIRKDGRQEDLGVVAEGPMYLEPEAK